jgi:hypothetical protein
MYVEKVCRRSMCSLRNWPSLHLVFWVWVPDYGTLRKLMWTRWIMHLSSSPPPRAAPPPQCLFDKFISNCTCECRMIKLWFDSWKLIQQVYVKLHMWMSNDQKCDLTVGSLFDKFISNCTCECRMIKLWFDSWKLIRQVYVKLHMWMSNDQIGIWHLEAYSTSLCQITHGCWMNKLFSWHGFSFHVL